MYILIRLCAHTRVYIYIYMYRYRYRCISYGVAPVRSAADR